jgi:transcriptional regulator with XRE-family HTH domain
VTSDGSAIKAIREAQKLSLRALSEITGLDRGYLSRVERGLIQRPDEVRVRAIAEALGVPVAAIDRRHPRRGEDVTAMVTKKRRPPAAAQTAPAELAELVHYTPDQVEEMKLLPYKARTLRDKANRREIPHSNAGGRIMFRLSHIREIAAMGDVRPISETKPSA